MGYKLSETSMIIPLRVQGLGSRGQGIRGLGLRVSGLGCVNTNANAADLIFHNAAYIHCRVECVTACVQRVELRFISTFCRACMQNFLEFFTTRIRISGFVL